MPNKPVPAAGEALPNAMPTDEQIADAMADLETPLYDLQIMASITADLAGEWFNRPMSSDGNRLVFHISKMQREKLLFAINDIEARIVVLKSAFMTARYGEDAR